MRDIQALLIGHFERVVLREFREDGLEARIEFRELALRDLISDLGRSIDLDEESEDLIVIRFDFVIRHIIIRYGRIDLSDKEGEKKRDDHQKDLGNGLGEQRFHGEI